MKNKKKHISIFASGNGTNTQAILEHFKGDEKVEIICVYSNKSDAVVLQRAKKSNIDSFTFNSHDFYHSNNVVEHLRKNKTDLIVLAGFMWLVPKSIVKEFIIVNIHPALLPKYGGKGMYGHHVHHAVVNNNETESGITIHYVTNEYDKGSIILQEKCSVKLTDTPESLADRVHKLEHLHYPQTIEKIVEQLHDKR